MSAQTTIRRRQLLALLCASLCACLCGCKSGDEVKPPTVDAQLIVGCDFDNPPFASMDEKGKPTGRDVDMMEMVAARLGRPVKWLRLPFQNLLGSVEAGEIEVACATLGISPDRELQVAFSRPYYVTDLVVVVRAGPDEPGTFSDLAGKRVAAAPGTTSERAVRILLPLALCVLTDSDERPAPERLLVGELDAIVMDAPNAEALLAEPGTGLARIRTPLTTERYAVAVSRTRKTLLARIDYVLDGLRRSGQLAELDQRYGL